MTNTTIDFDIIKKAQRAGWETGDYPRVGNTIQIIAEQLVEAADVRAGQRVLDVACGQGNAALAAARRFADATGVDYAVNLGPRTTTVSRPGRYRSRAAPIFRAASAAKPSHASVGRWNWSSRNAGWRPRPGG